MVMAGKKSIIIAAIAALVNGCALDDIAEKPTCTTSHDFSQQEETAYATEAAENLHQVCPDVTENIQFCYQNLKSPNNYLCTICSREQFFCNGECIDMPCTVAQCHYADDLVENAPPEYQGLPLENISCSKEEPKYPYCYSHDSRKSDYLCTRCAKASATPRYCAKTDSCVDTFCEDCDKVHVVLEINGEKTDLCAVNIDSAEKFVEASKELKSTEIYALTKDIDLSDFDAYKSGKVEDWKGFYQFGGKFIAPEPHTISIQGGNGTLSCGTSEACGLFPILEGATVHNISLDFNVTHTKYAGLLAGIISQSEIKHIKAKGNVSASQEWVGGIAGTILQNTALADITFSGKVDAPKANYVGGITGGISIQSKASDLQIEGATSISGLSYVGGIAGFVSDDVTLSNVKQSLDLQISGENIVGGIIGAATVPLSDLTSNGTVTMTTLGSSTDPHFAGGIVGLFSGNSLSNLTNKANLSITNMTDPALVGASIGGVVGAVLEKPTLKGLHNKGKISYNGNITPLRNSPHDCNTQVGGVFGILGNTNIITTIEDATNQGVITTENSECVGGIVGKGTNMTIRNAKNEAAISASESGVGGIIGTLMFDTLPLDTQTLTSSDLENTAEIKGLGYVGGIMGLVIAGHYHAVDLVFSNMKNAGMLWDTGVESNIFMPHGGIFGMMGANTRTLTLSGLENTGNIETMSTAPSGGLIGLWKNYEANTRVVPDDLKYILRRSFSRGNITGNTRLGGILGQLNLDRDHRRFTNNCKLSCYDSHIDVTIEDVFAEGEIKGGTDIGGLIGYLDASPATKKCQPEESDLEDNDCSNVTTETANYKSTSTLNIQNTYASIHTSGNANVTGLIGILEDYRNPSDKNKIAIDNFYYVPYTSNEMELSGIICNARTKDVAIPEVSHIYIPQNVYDAYRDHDYIASKVNTISKFENKVVSTSFQSFVGDKPLVDVLNENRGDHAEWKDELLPGTSNYYPTLLITQ